MGVRGWCREFLLCCFLDLSLTPFACSPCLCTPLLQGIINLGTSENKLCFDLLSLRVSPGAPLRGSTSSEGLSSLGLPGRLPPTRACWLPQQLWPGSQESDFQICPGDNFLCGLGYVTSPHSSCFFICSGPSLPVSPPCRLGHCSWGKHSMVCGQR